MSTQDAESKEITLDVRNVGGIEETTVNFEPGVTVLKGRNATNRTSLLQAIMAGCGSDDVSIKGDAERAEVTLTGDGESVTRTLARENGTVVSDGEGLVDDPEVAELFAFLLESNEARRAVANGDDLREIIMRPVDTTAIRAEIKQLEARKADIDDRLDEIDDLESRLPGLEERRRDLRDRKAETEGELEEVQAVIDAEETTVEDQREERATIETKLAELRDLRSELSDLRYDEETRRESIEALQEERDAVASELDDLPDVSEERERELRAQLDDRRDEHQRLERKVTELNTVVQFNEEMLDDARPHVQSALDGELGDGTDGPVTDKLLEGNESVTCWTCGTTVDRGKVRETLSLLKGIRSETTGRMDEVDAEIDRLDEELTDLRETRTRRRELEERLDRLDEEIHQHEAAIESMGERREGIESEIETVQAEVEDLRTDGRSDLLDLHEEANDLEFELGRIQNELESVEAEIEEVEAKVDERADLEAEREEVNERLAELRTKIERIQDDAIEAFNEHMETVLDLLEYRNLDRVWIERTETEVRRGRSKTTRPTFDLHVIRNPEDGAAYEDAVDHLSESEREVVGLVFALAGYLVHDVDERCPFLLLDSLESLDSVRIARLVAYVRDHSQYLVVALLPEDARAIDTDHRTVRDI